MKHKRILGYSALGLTLAALSVAFIKPVSANNILFRARAANLNNLSVTFSRATSTNSKGSYNNTDYVLTSKLQQSGLDVQASLTNGYAITSGSDVVRLNGASSTLLFSIPTNSSGVTNFRKITSISFVYNASYNVGDNYFDVYFSSVSDFSVSEKISVESTASATPTISNAHYIKIIGDKSHYAYFNSITINYSCAEAPEVVTLSSISVTGQTTEFNVGDSFEFGGTVTAHYSDSSTADVTSDATFTGYDMDETGEQTVTVSYTEGGITETTSYEIEVSEAGETTVADNLVSHGTFNMTCSNDQYSAELTFSTLSTGTIVIKYSNQFVPYTETQTFNWSISNDFTTVSFTNVSNPVASNHSHLESTNSLTVTFDENNSITALSLPVSGSMSRTFVYSA